MKQNRLRIGRTFIIIAAALMTISILGCAPPPKKPAGLYPAYSGPQIAVEPRTIRLGVSTLLKTGSSLAAAGTRSLL